MVLIEKLVFTLVLGNTLIWIIVFKTEINVVNSSSLLNSVVTNLLLKIFQNIRNNYVVTIVTMLVNVVKSVIEMISAVRLISWIHVAKESQETFTYQMTLINKNAV